MKIGIITHWNVPNYGSFLQAYALRNVVENLFPGTDVRVLSYIKPIHVKMYYSFEVHEVFRLWLINPHYYQDIIKRIKRYDEIKDSRSFMEYYDRLIPHSDKYRSEDLECLDYDVIILGSDILWDYSVSYFGQDEKLFGNGINTNKIAYAASFGTVKRWMKHPEYVSIGLEDLKKISVRDENSAIIVRDILGEKPEVVLDPTLLWDFDSDDHVVFPNIEAEYIAVYGTDFTDSQIADAIKFAQKHKLLLVSLEGDRNALPWCDIQLTISELSPFLWCGFIKNAYAVMTCTFHGLMFSLIYNKKIVYHATEFMIDKAGSFLERLGLSSILIDSDSFAEQISVEWEDKYITVNEVICRERHESISYLKNAMENSFKSEKRPGEAK